MTSLKFVFWCTTILEIGGDHNIDVFDVTSKRLNDRQIIHCACDAVRLISYKCLDQICNRDAHDAQGNKPGISIGSSRTSNPKMFETESS